jgi:putative membrane protein
MNTVSKSLLGCIIGTTVSAGAFAATHNALDNSFLTEATTANQKEITLSKQALTQASSADVKNFANKMISDHTKLAQSMKHLDPSITPSADTDPAGLGNTSGTDFDKTYMDTMVADHDKVVSRFESVASDSQYSADVRSAAKNALPTLKHHAAMAKTLDAKVK